MKGGGLVSIREEIDCIKDYLSVMNIRYGGKFTATMDIEGRILEKKTLKMILQPIVENAICHGLAGKIGKGCLIIQGKLTEDRYISFQICDDGKGMEESELAALQQSILETAKKPVSGLQIFIIVSSCILERSTVYELKAGWEKELRYCQISGDDGRNPFVSKHNPNLLQKGPNKFHFHPDKVPVK